MRNGESLYSPYNMIKMVLLLCNGGNKPILNNGYEFHDIQEPIFARRGNVKETINDPVFISNLINWGTKNRLNEFCFTFFLRDDIKKYIRGDLVKPDMNVTLGGHSLNYQLDTIKNTIFESKDQLKFFSRAYTSLVDWRGQTVQKRQAITVIEY
ncbi:hypothetical protein ACFO3D_07195 [Virgibacillus kekensis]|uniref:Uncharacterized protein n=1 Tax=Virgibacillus kekensis TaxID=202261 RepID=A0ABV9DGS5_9BACI